MSRKKNKGGLSPSSLSLFQACNRRFWNYKINKTPWDPDYQDDSTALRVGSAFHKVLEETMHELEGITFPQVKEWIKEFEVEQDELRIFAMLAKYKPVHAKAGLKTVAVEVELDTPEFIGYVDAIMEDPKKGEWWIVDNKTAASFSATLIPTLPHHPQLNLYACYVENIAEHLDLDPKMYAGCRYRVTTKSRLKQNKAESDKDYFERLKLAITSKDIIIPRDKMDPDKIEAIHKKVFGFVKRNKKEEAYPQNFANCMQYFRPCPWFSRCHGWKFTDGELEVIEG